MTFVAPIGHPLDWPVPFVAFLTHRSEDDVVDAMNAAVEKAGRAPAIIEDPDAIAAEVRYHEGEGNLYPDGDFPPEEAVWRPEVEYDLAPFVGMMEDGHAGWVQWFADECRTAVEDGRDGYLNLLLEAIVEPVRVVELPGDRVDIWDGWHRIAASIVRRSTTIPALVGDRCRFFELSPANRSRFVIDGVR